MANPNYALSYVASAAITANTIVKPGTNAGEAAQATGSTDSLIGVTDNLVAATGDVVDVFTGGPCNVKLGGTVAAGDFLTSDSNGLAITAAPSAGVNAQTIGKAKIAGVAGDLIPVILTLGKIQG